MPRESTSSSHAPSSVVDAVTAIRELETRLLHLKEELVASGARVDPDTEDFAFLVVDVAEWHFALPLGHTVEVVEMPLVSPLPTEVPGILGLVDYHGDTVAVVDLHALALRREVPIRADQILVMCEVDGRRFALRVDEAVEVATVSADAFTVSDKVLPGIMPGAGIVRIRGAQVFLVDLLWIAAGAHLGMVLRDDAVTPVQEDSP